MDSTKPIRALESFIWSYLMRIPLYCFLLACSLVSAQERPSTRQLTFDSGRTPLEARKADQLLDSANFVFVGTVVQNRASNLSSVASSSQTTLVRVDKVLHGTPLLNEMAGQVITVRSLRAAEHLAGQASTFFLDVDAFGESASGIEVGRFTMQSGDEERNGTMVAQARGMRNDRELTRRVKMAEHVVQGRVVSVEPAGIEERTSEHAAHWNKAVIEVQSVIKGRAGAQTLTMYFPTSEDRMWRDAPHYNVGQEGLWLLHAKPMDYSRKAAMVPGLTALDPKDFHNADQLPRIQQLISNR